MIYVDSSAIMRLVCGDSDARLRFATEIGDESLLTSSLAIVECFCKPMRLKDDVSLHLLHGFFASANVTVVPVSNGIAMQAATLRAQLRLKTPDAVHVATAQSQPMTKLLTTDSDFAKARAVLQTTVVVLEP
jgi:predicted nucleic acid-binding protein